MNNTLGNGPGANPGEELRVGIIGCGNISSTYLGLAPLFKGYRIIACADIDMSVASAQAAEYAVEALSVDAILEREEIDLVVNLTVPDVHVSVSTRILEAGKHVYSEKPLSLNLQEGLALQSLANARQLKVGCAPDTFFGGAHQLARQLLDEGRIGQLTGGTCHVMNHGMEHWHPNPDFFFRPGAGPILDLGPYYIANLINFIGPVKRVAALSSMASETRTIANGDRLGETIPVSTPTNVHALLEFHSGATITLSSSWDVWYHEHNHMELYGTEGSLLVPDPNFFHGTVRLAGKEGGPVDQEPLQHPFNILNQQHEDGDRANYRGAGLADMALAICAGTEYRCSLDRTLHAVDVMVSILQSGEQGQFVDVVTSCSRPDALDAAGASNLLRAAAN